MRTIIALFCTAFLLGACVTTTTTAPAPEAQTTAAVAPASLSQDEARAIALINDRRAQSGRAALTIDPRLVRAAKAHASDMGARGFFSHTGSNGSNHADRIRRQGYKLCYASENIASGQTTPEQVVTSWMESRQHRDNIMNRRGAQVGLGKVGTLWVAVFAQPC